MLSEITPVILTWNEEQNIARCLGQLDWARTVLVIDSFSDDRTVEIAEGFENVRVLQHRFPGFAEQWKWALDQELTSEWILALDADYVVTDSLIEEIEGLDPKEIVDGYRVSFDWAVHGRTIRASLYPPLVVLFRKSRVTVARYGHAQKAIVETERSLTSRIIHDDRKPISRWFSSQIGYAQDEAGLLMGLKSSDTTNHDQPPDARQGSMSRNDRLRRVPFLTTLLVPIYLLIFRGLILDGRAGLHYTLQRTISEAMISLAMIDAKLRGR